MSATIESSQPQASGSARPTPAEVTAATQAARAREEALSRLLMAFITSGIVFMLLPGTFLGVWNLLRISGGESAGSVSPAWLQAHGHAQVFGWIGSFIFGIGFYSIPKLRGASRPPFNAAWACWALWTSGVAVHWAATVYGWYWRWLVPISAVMELVAFAVFFRAVSQHKPRADGRQKLEPWIWVVISASVGLMLSLIANLSFSIYLGWRGVSPAIPHALDQRYLVLMTWGFLVPFVWGFSAKWMGVFLGLKPIRPALLVAAVAVTFTGVLLNLSGFIAPAMVLFVVAAILAVAALRMFEPSQNVPKTRGVHSSFPWFVRIAYGWLVIAALLGIAAAAWDLSGGIWGASRHALTVGFVAVMVFSVGQRILPAFAGMRALWSTKLMLAGLLLLVTGCTLRVSSEVVAYQGYAAWAWSVLPVSALIELAAVTVFGLNIMGTFILEPSHAQAQPVIMPVRETLSH